MPRWNRTNCRAAFALGAVVLAAAPAGTQGRADLAALRRLQPGLWQLRDLGNPGRALPPVCIGDPAVLTQLQHPRLPCSRVVISSDLREATVHYTCRDKGFGRTTVRVETARLATIDSQGIIDNAPFAFRAEARRTGPCTGPR